MINIFTLFLGCLLLGIGIIGAMTGGHNHELIVFGINTNHNLVHILSGILGILTALVSSNAAKFFCLGFGVVYGIVTVAGFIKLPQAVSLLNLNDADNFLHLAITAGCLYFGWRAVKG